MSSPDLNASPEIAEQYLEEYFKRWLAQQSHFTSQEREQKLAELKHGLAYFLNHADDVQEALIELTQAAALKTILVDGLLVAIDQNPDVNSRNQLATLLEKTVNTLLERNESPALTYKLSDTLWPLVKKTQREPGRENSRKLRKAIEEWAIHADIYPRAVTENSITLFRRSREAHTQAINAYQAALVEAKLEVEQQLELKQYDESLLFLKPGSDLDEEIKTLLEQEASLGKRLIEVDSFRAGVLDKLPAQAESIDALEVKDIDDVFRSFKDRDHPRLTQINNMRATLRKMISSAPNPYYKGDIPGVRIKESGKKSWKSAIRKLFDEKGGDWDNMKDLSRINPVFSNAESMYFYNRALHSLAPHFGWQHTKINGKDGDKGPKMHDSATVNWITSLKYIRPLSDLVTDKNYYAETKSDPLSISRSEGAGHLLFEIARSIYEKDRQVNLKRLADPAFKAALTQKILSTVDLLEMHKSSFNKDVIQNLQQIGKMATFLNDRSDIFDTLLDSVVKLFYSIDGCILFGLQRQKRRYAWRSGLQYLSST